MACIHSKFLEYQLLESLSLAACQSIEQFKKLYTWTSSDGKDEEMDGLTILALVINHICCHYKVDMYLKIKKIKKENLEQYENNLELFFDRFAITSFTLIKRTHWHTLRIICP
jgi:hypothetical protein